ncbi:MFS transporter [Kibdelosporangium persicum]|uniref:Transmembrane secretion effector n=1 Tax=Kibdelosporangium persicum TaxID=2698649 RepID=A0ABX2F9U7_9PSEU|nr:MFS transporter [Kibdelosporangium persicum]NRN67700.1 Transmembrane secretion effector [Kibdelosporangium persicum]
MRTTPTATVLPAGFRWFWGSQTMSFVGDRLTGFAVPSAAILVLNASSAQVGLVSAAGWLAYPAFGMVAGALLAGRRRRHVMITGELVRFVAFLSIPLAALAGWLSVTQMVVVVALAGVATVFVDIASQSYLPTLVAPGQLFAANSRLQGSDSLSKLIGPALAGAVMNLLGGITAIAVNALPFLFSAFGRTRVGVVEDLPPRLESPPSIAARIRVGLAFVWSRPPLRQVVCGTAVRGFGTGIVDAVLLLFAYRALGLSSLGGGLLLAAGAVGALLGALLTQRIAGRIGVRAALLASAFEGLLWLAVPVTLFAAPVVFLVAIRVCSAFWLPVWNVLTTSIRQSLTPPGEQSGVHATARTLASSTIPLGSLVAGFAAGALGSWFGTATGLVVVLAVGGVCTAASVLLVRDVPELATTQGGGSNAPDHHTDVERQGVR